MSDVLQVVESVIHEQEPPLSTGLYTVRTVPSLQIVGRNIVEEDSNNPKVINGQPLGVPINDNTTFLFRRVGGDTFFISCGRDGGRVVEMEGKVVAVFSDVPEDPFEYFVNPRWIIQRQPQHGDDIYTIESENGYWGWVMPTENPQYTPVRVRQLAATATMPPRYPPNQLWVIERVG
ncbi:hypothetical protein AGABI1DRAFT_82896 [Agaricus bisporus var. burnettii JB137-S8]|uniref:Uncharacterized protein n=1 Tax=Agaricus bisporus var. burnettii (strain JB137-S8 / ATCC MYA-4627 / FGSC 10392) TaxID=597362 RepID=K5W8T5_AGABU|nr:hypothetical protein AGABI2DRAFT_190956 [Agaricus bisporus var. bisporus H97]XP_007326786.1 uncharacterized protein AGABI1DRAFT_82896 [Agaricus bisporus var. burnettii JB137-S8]EKM83284.1 hypothetical protein AGABI1DRAFT_82896 [Agaricus bisporus var. burnettii JB137-S8]EKV50728.1 hypothetical protein AGABI2DRAFT_190956 [Agaricus bisporus var. bisporus H97]